MEPGMQDSTVQPGSLMEEMGITESMVTASGSVLGLSGAQAVIDVQRAYLGKSRLGIPLLFMADVVHGFKTIFPIPLAIGCSWDVDLCREKRRRGRQGIWEEQLRYHHADLRCASDPGMFRVYVGPNSRDTAEHSFKLNRSN